MNVPEPLRVEPKQAELVNNVLGSLVDSTNWPFVISSLAELLRKESAEMGLESWRREEFDRAAEEVSSVAERMYSVWEDMFKTD
jgi:hypothetical protein